MPIYEYNCSACNKRFSLLVGVVAGEAEIACPRCGGAEVTKLMSRFSTVRLEEDLLDDIPEPSNPDDPAAVREWMGKMGEEMGEDFEEEFDSYMSEEGGEGPEEEF